MTRGLVLASVLLGACAGRDANLCAGVPASGAKNGALTGTLVIRGGTIHTMDPARPRADIAIVEGGKFTCVGSVRECGVVPNARVVDLRGGSAVPGLVDAHGHIVSYGRSLAAVALSGCAPASECVERLAARAKALPPGAWVVGRGWDQTRWPGQAFPDEAELSRAIPDHPVFATRVDGHAAWVNAKALAIAGITSASRDPDGGSIARYADGKPSGVLVDNAVDLVATKLPKPSAAEIERAILDASKHLLEVGITGVHDAGVSAEELEVFRRLAREDRLPVRVYAMLDGQAPMPELRAQMELWKKTPEIGRLTVRAVKMYADGALGSRGALLFDAYADDPKTSGLAVTPGDELRRRILEVTREGFQPAVHAIGDRANAETLADFVEASKLRADVRPRVEHMQILQAKDVHLLRESRAIASMQPTHATSDGPWAEARLGHGTPRQLGAYAWRQALDAGAPLACGSDFPVEDIDPRAGLSAAESRAWMPEQRLTRQEAVRCFTAGAAYASFAESRRGLIKEGYDADVTAFAKDLFAVPVAELAAIPITYVLIGGRIEHAP